jgi:prepilin-type N-terminal cleavage/methylation domain-containing protein/prepilin-type processing-associated H-X9-DG protein
MRPAASEVFDVRRPHIRYGFTLIELVVVIAIVAMLMGLLLSAVQQVRHAAARIGCAHNVRQLALAMHHHHDAIGHLPSDGWGAGWMGYPGLGSGRDQPGSWVYNLLPYIEQQNVAQLGAGGTLMEVADANALMVQMPLPGLNCPSRRPAKAYPGGWSGYWNCQPVALQFRGDYAVNTGDLPYVTSAQFNGSMGPPTLALAATYAWPDPNLFTGVSFCRSEIPLTQITNGTSNTFLLGEKYVDAAHYFDGMDWSDDQNIYTGFDDDNSRCTTFPPMRDTPGVQNSFLFGSAHQNGLNMAYCDGSVRFISFSIDPAVFQRAGNRH